MVLIFISNSQQESKYIPKSQSISLKNIYADLRPCTRCDLHTSVHTVLYTVFYLGTCTYVHLILWDHLSLVQISLQGVILTPDQPFMYSAKMIRWSVFILEFGHFDLCVNLFFFII